MGSIFEDVLSDPYVGNLLGIGSAKAATPPPSPPQQVMQNAPSSFSPTSTFDAGGAAGGPLSFADRAQPVQTAIDQGTFSPKWDPYNTDFKPPRAPPPVGAGGAGGEGGGGPGLPAVNAGGSQPAGGPVAAGGVPTGPLAALAPPMPPPFQLNNGPPTMSSGGGLAAALGLGTPQAQQSALAGVGRGMSAVGAMRPGAPKGAAFATGLGGGIQGQQAKEVEQAALQRQAMNDHFTKSSTAFRDMMAAKAADDTSAYREAQGKYLQARAAALTTGEGSGSKSWWLSDTGKLHMAETETQKWEDAQIRRLSALYPKDGGMDDERRQAYKDLDKMREQKLQQNYKKYGVDPKNADKIRTRGESKENPFPPGTTEEIPLFGWLDTGKKYGPDGTVTLGGKVFRGKPGEPAILQRKKPPPGATGPAPAPDTAATLSDDQTAMGE